MTLFTLINGLCVVSFLLIQLNKPKFSLIYMIMFVLP